MIAKDATSDLFHLFLEPADSLFDQVDEFCFGGIETGFVSVQAIKDDVEVSRHGGGKSCRKDLGRYKE